MELDYTSAACHFVNSTFVNPANGIFLFYDVFWYGTSAASIIVICHFNHYALKFLPFAVLRL